MAIQFYWHIHHDRLLEPVIEPIEQRIDYIRKHKAAIELPLRERLLRPVRGKLPEAVTKAATACVKIAHDIARAGRDIQGIDQYKVWDLYRKAVHAQDKAWDAYNKAMTDHIAEIEALHRIECPNCPWNGETVFPTD